MVVFEKHISHNPPIFSLLPPMNSLRHGTPETPENHGFKKNAVADAVAKIMNHYVPKEGDSMQTVADILGVVPASLKNNLFILPV